MKTVKKIFSFDFFLCKRDKVFLLAFAFVFLLCLVYACSAFYFSGESILTMDRASQLEAYTRELEKMNALLSSGELGGEDQALVLQRIRLLAFYLSTSSVAADYVNPGQLVSLGSPYQGVAFAFKDLSVAFLFLTLYVPFVFYRYVLSHGVYASKSFLMAPVNPKDAFFANVLFFLGLVAIPLLGFLVPASIGLSLCGNPSILIEKASGYSSFPVACLLLSFSFSLLVYTLVMAALTFLFFLFFHKDYAALAGPLLIALASVALFSILSLSGPSVDSFEEKELAGYFPLLSLYHLAFYPASAAYWVSFSLHLVFASALAFLSYRRFRKEGYC